MASTRNLLTTAAILLASVAVLAILPAAPAPAASKVPADKAMAAELKDFSASGTLEQVVAAIEEKAGVQIAVDWTSLIPAGAKKDTKVSVKSDKATAAQMLDSALGQLKSAEPLSWFAKGDIVNVASQARILALKKSGGSLEIAAVSSGKPGAAKEEAKPVAAKESAGMSSVEFTNTPFADFVEFIRKGTGVNVHVNWKALEASGISRDTAVSLTAKDIGAARALDLILDDLNAGKGKIDSVYWVIDKGVLQISTGTALDTEMRTKVYEIKDLLMPIPNFDAPTLDLGNNNNANTGTTGTGSSTSTSDGSTTAIRGEIGTAEARQKLKDNLIGTLQDTIGKDFWEPIGKGSIKIVNGQMIISQSLLGFKLMEKASGK